jgi:hypothetical protein
MPTKALVLIALVLTCFLVVAYVEHKVMAHMQARVGPIRNWRPSLMARRQRRMVGRLSGHGAGRGGLR